MMLIDEIAQIIRINERHIGASQTAQLIVNLLADKGYGRIVLQDPTYICNIKVHPINVFIPIDKDGG